MKKLLVFALVLVFTGAAVFAAEVADGFTIGGEVKTGVSIQTKEDGLEDKEDTTAVLWNDSDALRANLTFKYDVDAGGAMVRLATANDPGKILDKAYGWANFLDKKIVLYGGIIDGDLWGLGKLTNAFDPSVDAVTGVRVAFNELVPGLSFGLALPLANQASPAAGEADVNDSTALGNAFSNVSFGALYKQSLFGVVADLKLNQGEKEKEDPTSTTVPPATYDVGPWLRVLFGAEVKPIDMLAIGLDVDFDSRTLYEDPDAKTLKDLYAKNGYFKVGARVSFTAPSFPLTAYVKGNALIQNASYPKFLKGRPVSPDEAYLTGLSFFNEDDMMYGMAFEEAAAEAKDKHAEWVPVENWGDVAIKFTLGADYVLADGIKAALEVGTNNVAYLAGNGLYVKPGVTFTLGPCEINIFDKIAGLGMDEIKGEEGATGKDDSPKTYSQTTNQFQINFKWSF
jgi:hypothetical protein